MTQRTSSVQNQTGRRWNLRLAVICGYFLGAEFYQQPTFSGPEIEYFYFRFSFFLLFFMCVWFVSMSLRSARVFLFVLVCFL